LNNTQSDDIRMEPMYNPETLREYQIQINNAYAIIGTNLDGATRIIESIEEILLPSDNMRSPLRSLALPDDLESVQYNFEISPRSSREISPISPGGPMSVD
jgi:hypothetical protein